MIESDEVLYDEPMARHTSWRVGGPADAFFRPRTVESLRAGLAALPPGAPVLWIGLGSNLLVRDAGVRGTVLCTSGLPRDLEQLAAAGVLRASASLPCATLARRAARARLGPAAFFAGIPGTVGGALAMNAGAFGTETWDIVVAVRTIDRRGEIRERSPAQFDISYRSVRGLSRDECFLSADFQFDTVAGGEIEKINALLEQRSDSQPIGPPSAGSVFRNPEGHHAARLIEAAGLKGLRLGGAVISPKHANFILNEGNASAADIEGLIERARAEVERKFGIRLETEVRIVGERNGGDE